MKTQEQEQSGINAPETNKPNSGSKELIKQTEIEGTPFKKIETENEMFIGIGNYRLTDKLNEFEGDLLELELKRTNWKFMIAVIGAITNQTVLTYKGEL